ncbi:MAG: VCBS repeat-containing protein [Deltaproteobacteria bacterium]|nr:VCBS repeat-containing protein [Deltaproteobacteria bacterium]
MKRKAISTLWILVCLLLMSQWVKSEGLSPSRIRLPKGPGSLEGIGENVEANLNMGLAGYEVPISLPGGYNEFAPELSLAYSSGAGASVVGIGWSLGMPTIERMTVKGLPVYDATDRFASDGVKELVHIPDTRYWRERFEGSFIRYTWSDILNEGKEGYWIAEYPDGSVGYFGADGDGQIDEQTRIDGYGGVFRYHLKEMRDTLGHRIVFTYRRTQGTAYITDIEWAFVNDAPHYAVRFSYEPREDVISDGKPGVETLLTQRLVDIKVTVDGAQLRRYELSYEPYDNSGGFTRLQKVETFGTDNLEPYPVHFSFSYTGTFDPMCEISDDCRLPSLHDMGIAAAGFGTGNAELMDINGDGLPDVVDTVDGRHRLYMNQLPVQESERHTFSNTQSSTVATGGSLLLSSSHVELLDLDGNGHSDMVDGKNGRVLWNFGKGDWTREQTVNTRLPDFTTDENLRFFDYDGDKRPDVIHSDGNNTWFYRNMSGGSFSKEGVIGETLGWGFIENPLKIADMNGDGLQDAVLVLEGSLVYRLYLGYGRWSAPVEMFGLPEPLDAEHMQLVDLNGDSLADAVAVLGNEVLISFNKSGVGFSSLWRVQDVEGIPIPQKDADMSIRYADMNGSGSTDIVWIDRSGNVKYLELLPQRANLLSKVENGIGKVVKVYYETTVARMARDGGSNAWTHRLPHPMLTVKRIENRDTLSGVRQIQTFHYSNGYYDGEERQFKGFENVVVETAGDDSVEQGRVEYQFDVGTADRYRSGLLLNEALFSDNRAIYQTRYSYSDCDVDEVPDTMTTPVRYLCQTGKEQVVKEGRSDSEWVTVTDQYYYDGYGNRIETANHGITRIGNAGCPSCSQSLYQTPCGEQCTGDEMFTETDFVTPDHTGEHWLINLPAEERVFSDPASGVFSRTLTFYDGDDFVGLPLGEATQGLRTRVVARVNESSSRTIDVERSAFDSHGNVTVSKDANGHDVRFVYDELGLKPIAEERTFQSPLGAPYSLRMEVSCHPVLETPVTVTGWMRIDDSNTIPEMTSVKYAYDSFGRLSALARPGDTLDAPTTTYQYELADPVSRIVTRQSSVAGAQPDLEKVVCFDGMGRNIQERIKTAEGLYQVSGFAFHNSLGIMSRSYQPWVAASGNCDIQPPDDVLFSTANFDSTGRVLSSTFPDTAIFGTPSTTRTEYGPLWTGSFDGEDNDATSVHFDTPTIKNVDGLGRLISIKQKVRDGAPIVTTFGYDELGRLQRHVDSLGNEKFQMYDLAGRVTSVQDPDTGVTSFEYDDVGNRIARTDSRGTTVKYAFDEAGRVISQWDEAAAEQTRIDYYYDGNGNCATDKCTRSVGLLTATVYPLGDGTFATDLLGYDARQRVTYRARRLAGLTLETRYAYDNADRLISTHHPDGTEVRRDLDSSGRETAVPDIVSSVSYNQAGLPDKMVLANGVGTMLKYDSLQRPDTITAANSNGEMVLGYSYVYDRVGNILAVDDHRLGKTQAPTAQAEYGYDNLYRLKTARLDTGNVQPEVLTYAFDAIGNIVDKSSSLGKASLAHVGAYSYGSGAGPHAVTRAGDMSFHYDAAGNMVQHGKELYNWNHLGQLASVQTPQGPPTEFGYDAGGQRVYKRNGTHEMLYITPDFEIRDGIATTYVQLHGNRVAKKESTAFAAKFLADLAPITGNDSSASSHGDGRITAADAWVAHARKKGYLAAPPGNVESVSEQKSDLGILLSAAAMGIMLAYGEQTTWLHHNHLGSTAATTDKNGNILQRTEHYPFGEIRYQSHYLEDYTFTGQERDLSTGLSYHAARYLDPRLGRWISADPMFEVLGEETLKYPFEALNLYTYSSNSPVVYIDRTGTNPLLQALRVVLKRGLRKKIKSGKTLSPGSRLKAYKKFKRKHLYTTGETLPRHLQKDFMHGNRGNKGKRIYQKRSPFRVAEKQIRRKFSIEEHHGIPYKNEGFPHYNHQLVRKAGTDIEKYERNKRLLEGHRGRHGDNYNIEIKTRLDTAWEELKNEMGESEICQETALKKLNSVIDNIFNDIANSTLKLYDDD